MSLAATPETSISSGWSGSSFPPVSGSTHTAMAGRSETTANVRDGNHDASAASVGMIGAKAPESRAMSEKNPTQAFLATVGKTSDA